MSSFIGRTDPRHGEMVDVLLQFMKIINKDELYEPLAKEVKMKMDNILMKVNLFSYLKRRYHYPIFAHPGCYEVLEIICGKNYSQIYLERYPGTGNTYREIESLRDRCNWKKIVFNYLSKEEFIEKRNSSRFFSDKKVIFVIVASTNAAIFKGGISFADLRFFDQFFRLDHNDSEKLVIDYLFNANRTFEC